MAASAKCSMCRASRPKTATKKTKKKRSGRRRNDRARPRPDPEENITHDRAWDLAEQCEKDGDLQGALDRLLQAASLLPNPAAAGGADLRTRLAAAKVSRGIARLDGLLAREAAEARARATEERRAQLLDEELDESLFDMAPADGEEADEAAKEAAEEEGKPAEEPGGGGAPGGGEAADQWACSFCTFLNHVSQTKCEMCGMTKKKKADDGNVRQWVRQFGGGEASGEVM